MRKGHYGRIEPQSIYLATSAGAPYTGALAAGDVQVSIDGAAPTNVSALPVSVGRGHYIWTPTADEKDGRDIVVTWADADGSAFLAGALNIDQADRDAYKRGRLTAVATQTSVTMNNAAANDSLANRAVLVEKADGSGSDIVFISANTAGALTLTAASSLTLAAGDYVTVIPAAADQGVYLADDALTAAALAADAVAELQAAVGNATDQAAVKAVTDAIEFDANGNVHSRMKAAGDSFELTGTGVDGDPVTAPSS